MVYMKGRSLDLGLGVPLDFLSFIFFVLHPHSTPPDLEGWADRVKEEPLGGGQTLPCSFHAVDMIEVAVPF